MAKFADLETFPHVFQVKAQEIRQDLQFEMQGKWNEMFFGNNHPIVLELGCGKGEYTVSLARLFPEKNFIGVDIKGARLWTGAKDAHLSGLKNVAFLRTNVEMINHFFGLNEVDEIWLTFPDPQMKKLTKRLTATNFMALYQQFVKPEGLIHLKTDSNFMYTYTQEMIKANGYVVNQNIADLYAQSEIGKVLSIKTYYEQQWLGRGLTIKYLQFVLNKREQFVEPDVEIEHDSYRSFGRNQRQSIEVGSEE